MVWLSVMAMMPSSLHNAAAGQSSTRGMLPVVESDVNNFSRSMQALAQTVVPRCVEVRDAPRSISRGLSERKNGMNR
jgi:hypothetical protein